MHMHSLWPGLAKFKILGMYSRLPLARVAAGLRFAFADCKLLWGPAPRSEQDLDGITSRLVFLESIIP